MKRRWLVWLVCLALYLVAVEAVAADGFIIPVPPPGRPLPPQLPTLYDLTVKYHRVTVTIDDQVATTHVDQVFVSELGYEVEGTYLFPLPEGASISSFSMWVNGAQLQAEVLERDKAREIYESIVREKRDPALLEYVGRNAFRASIYPIAPQAETRVEIEYTEVLAQDGGLVKYVYPLNTEKFSARPLERVSVSVALSARQPLKAIYSPSHPVAVSREGESSAQIGYEESNVRPAADYVLYYSVAGDDLGLNVISYAEPGEDGYFLMLAASPVQVEATEVVARDVFIVLDISGSMRGDKMAQAKDAARYVLDHLIPEDRFNIVAFSTGTRHFARGLRPASEVDAAHRFVSELQAAGGTNIARALEETLEQTRTDRPQVVLFLTDGLPTEGEIRAPQILARVGELAGKEVSLFAFGVGYDVNTFLLDRLAQDHHGTSVYVRPTEDLTQAVSAFYEKISTPVLTNLRLAWSGVAVDELYPYPLPDLFAGGQLVVVGRYRQGGDGRIELTGLVNGRQVRFTYNDVRLRTQGGADFIPRLWATRKIGYLLTQIELHGANRELVDEVIALSVRHGIITPYTSFLIDETEDALTAEGRGKIAERELPTMSPQTYGRGGVGGGAPAAPSASGEAAVEKSIVQNTLRQADMAATPQAGETLRVVGNRTFVLRQEVWTDTAYDAATMPTEKVPFGGARYLELARASAEWARYASLGERVLLVWEGRAYEVTPAPLGALATLWPTTEPTPGAAAGPSATGQPTPERRATDVGDPTVTPQAVPTPKPSTVWDLVRGWLRALVD